MLTRGAREQPAARGSAGANPFQYGTEAATDTHTGLSAADDAKFSTAVARW
jgi:hypothetical protein